MDSLPLRWHRFALPAALLLIVSALGLVVEPLATISFSAFSISVALFVAAVLQARDDHRNRDNEGLAAG